MNLCIIKEVTCILTFTKQFIQISDLNPYNIHSSTYYRPIYCHTNTLLNIWEFNPQQHSFNELLYSFKKSYRNFLLPYREFLLPYREFLSPCRDFLLPSS